MLTKIVTYLRTNWILIDDYNYPERKIFISARENKLRLAAHFLFPALVSTFISYLDAPILIRALWVLIWGVFTIKKEWRESAWQKPVKTRSDILSKLLGLVMVVLP